MSQHKFVTRYRNSPVQVLMGWDRPLQGFYLVIELLLDPTEEEAEEVIFDGFLYSNLADKALAYCNGLPSALNHFMDKLVHFQIELPPEMIRQVLLDRTHNVGNAGTDHSVIISTESGIKVVPAGCLLPGATDKPSGLLELVDLDGRTVAELTSDSPWELSSVCSMLAMPKAVQGVATAGCVAAHIGDLWVGATHF